MSDFQDKRLKLMKLLIKPMNIIVISLFACALFEVKATWLFTVPVTFKVPSTYRPTVDSGISLIFPPYGIVKVSPTVTLIRLIAI